MIVGAVLYALLSFVLTGLLNVLARLFGGTSTVLELYRPLGLATPIYWVQAVPLLGSFLGILAVLYFFVVAGVTLETAGGLDRPRAVAVMGILAGVSVFLVLVFFAMLGSLVIFRALFA